MNILLSNAIEECTSVWIYVESMEAFLQTEKKHVRKHVRDSSGFEWTYREGTKRLEIW